MKKNEKNEKNSWLRYFFGLEAGPEGIFRGQVTYTEVLEPLGYRGGAKMAKKAQKLLKKWIKMSKCEKNCKISSIFGLVPLSKDGLRV